MAIGCCNTKENTSWNIISCEVNQTERGEGMEHGDDNVPSDKSGYANTRIQLNQQIIIIIIIIIVIIIIIIAL